MHTRTLLGLLLFGCATLHAGTAAGPPGVLSFSIQPHPGEGGWLECHLNAKGTFIVRRDATSISGACPAALSLRIMEEFEKLCTAAGEDRFPYNPRFVGRPVPPYFHFASPRGKVLYLEGPENRLPPELTAFMITLTQKLLDQASKTPRAAPPPPIRTF